MPRVSRREMDEGVKESSLHLLYAVVGEMGKDDARQMFKMLLTPEERLMLAKRLAGMALLSTGYSYRQLDKILRLVPVTTGKIKKMIKQNPKVARDLVSLAQNLEEGRDFYKTVKTASGQNE